MWTPYKVMRARNLFFICALVSVVLFTAFHRNENIIKQFQSFAESLIYIGPVTMRHNLTFYTNVSTGFIPPETTNVSTMETLFHRFASELQVVCPESKRYGKTADGGWDVCIYSTYKPRQSCLIYSFGINNDWSFDDSMVEAFNCTVRAFDPSMTASDHRRGHRIWFYKQGISGANFVNSNGWQLRTLDAFIKMFNEADETIDYLKIDVEYSEWSALEAILNSTVLSRVKQFGLETHTRELMKKPSTAEDFRTYTELLRRLKDAGFYRWYWHYNNFGVFVSSNSKQKITCCYEMVFLNVNIPFV